MKCFVSEMRCVCIAALKIRCCTLVKRWVESWYYCLRFAHNKFKMTLSLNILFMVPLRHCRIECSLYLSLCVCTARTSIHLDACKLCKLQWSTHSYTQPDIDGHTKRLTVTANNACYWRLPTDQTRICALSHSLGTSSGSAMILVWLQRF